MACERLTFSVFDELLEEENWPDRVYLHPNDFSILKSKSIPGSIQVDPSDGQYIVFGRTKVFSGPIKILNLSASQRWTSG